MEVWHPVAVPLRRAGAYKAMSPYWRELATTGADCDSNRVLNFVIGRGSSGSRLFLCFSELAKCD